MADTLERAGSPGGLRTIANVALHQSARERLLTAEVADLKLIHGLSLRLADADTLEDVLMDVLRTAKQLVDASLGTVQLVNADGKLEMIGEIGFGAAVADKFAIVTLADCSTCAVALNRRARVTVTDLRTDHDFTQIAAVLCSYGAIGAVSTPVLDKAGNVLAMFSVYWPEQHQPDDRELQALDLCAELAGRHVERSVAARALRDHDERQALLMRELSHRGKNLLAVIQAIATRSLRGDRPLDEARDAFIGRLGALSNTYNTLTDEAPESVQLADIVAAGMRSHGERINVQGPAILIPARKAQTLALVLHELATNAAKYGALSSPSGRVEITWDITWDITPESTGGAEPQFVLNWSETGGPAAHAPAQKGFGTTIITTVVGDELNCAPTLEYRPGGFHYRLCCERSALVDGDRLGV